MSAITFTLGFTGTPDLDDILAARHIVRLENERRTAQNVAITEENVRRAAQDPPLAALPLLAILPTATGAELKASYLGLFLATVTSAHLSYIEQAKSSQSLTGRLTEDQMKQLIGAVTTRLNNGDSVATILADVAS